MKSPQLKWYQVAAIVVGLVLVLRFVPVPVSRTPTAAPVKKCPCEPLELINQQYVATVKPIFAKKCLDCHGDAKRLPLYGVLPPSNMLINHDIDEAHGDFDMSHDFPFGAKGSYTEQLESIQWVVDHNEMPPLKYKIMHWSSSLNREEKRATLAWINQSVQALKRTGDSVEQ